MSLDTATDEGTRPSSHGTDLLDRLGRAFMATGVLLLLFTAYMVWGTGIRQNAEQRQLERQFRGYSSQIPELPLVGNALGKISIPVIDVNAWLVAGAKFEQLERGPGVFAGSPLPGQVGNVAIAGHRESYGGPFEHIDMLQRGDEIVFTTQQGTFTYRVTGSRIISANEVSVIQTLDPDRAIVTLVTCHPKWTSDERLIVRGELVSMREPLRATPVAVVDGGATTATGVSADTVNNAAGWFHDPSRVVPTLVWGVLSALVWVVARRIRWQGWSLVGGWTLAAVVLLACLFMTFENLTGLLPTNL